LETATRRENCDREEREANNGGDSEEREAPPWKEREAR